jgi:hypothetical protein
MSETQEVIIRLKLASGISVANCATCGNLGSEDDGGDPPCRSWPICHRFDRYGYLRSFPFKKEMSCWTPHFWHSKFADKINGEKPNDDAVFAEWNKAIDEAEADGKAALKEQVPTEGSSPNNRCNNRTKTRDIGG